MRLDGSLPVIVVAAAVLVTPASAAPAGSTEAKHARSIPSYYPHWVTREGAVTPAIMTRLPPGAMIGAHHEWDLAQLRRILDFPGKRFQISWYVEANVAETDDPTPTGTPVKARIAEARRKQDALVGAYGTGRFAYMVELNGSRDKKDGNLRGRGNSRADWLRDAAEVKAAGLRYLAKSPAPAHVDELRSKFGRDFVPRIVFEDVTGSAGNANPGYRVDAKALAARGETVTLVIHSRSYGDFPATPIGKARTVVAAEFGAPATEAYWGRATAAAGFELVKAFGQTMPTRSAGK